MRDDRTKSFAGPWAGVATAVGAVGGGLALWSALAARGAEAMVPPIGEYLDIDGARIHYVDKGAGPAILLVHGLLGNLRHFTYAMVDDLAKDHRVVAIDRPGSGYSTAARGGHPTIEEQARLVIGVADALGLEKPLLVGHSLGGAVALAAGLAEPERFAGLALIAPLTQPIDTPPPVFEALTVPSALRGLMAWTVAVPLGTLTGKATAAQVFAPEPVPADFVTRGGGALSLRPRAFRAGSMELRAARDAMAELAPRYGTVKLPVSMLYGRDDALLDAALHGEATAATVPGLHLDLVDGGHMLPITQPERTTRFVREAFGRSR